MAKENYMIQMTDTEAAKMLQTMAKDDLRSYGNQVAFLIRQEFARRSPSNTEHNTAAAEEKQTAEKA